MKKLQPYFAIDIETTGLDVDTSQILEIGCVFDDWVQEIGDLPRFSVLTAEPVITGSIQALSMNKEIINAIKMKAIEDVPDNSTAVSRLVDFIHSVTIKHHNKTTTKIEDEVMSFTINLAGKNIGMFDLKFLEKCGFSKKLKRLPDSIKYRHRLMDVGSMYFYKFGYVPNLSEINVLLTGNGFVSHGAIPDCLDVVHAIRSLMSEQTSSVKGE